MAASLGCVTVDEIDAVRQLLREQHLPTAGLEAHLATTLVARDGGRLVGSAALEVYPHGALLRSVAVATERQGQGLGRELTEAAVRLAREIQAPAIYLLTTTAQEYFPKFGFEPIERADVPASVRRSIEFISACPSSATVMRKSLSIAGVSW
jgi:amino-acid N-acetyltransferase